MIDPVVDQDWLRAHGDRVVLADVRWYLDGRSGRAAYDSGHLPGAVFVDLNRVLAGPASPADGRHPLPDPRTFAAELAGLGVGDGDTVIGYDDAGGTVAARLVWLLRITGHEAALLDGGLSAYGGELDRTEAHRPPADLHAAPVAGRPDGRDRGDGRRFRGGAGRPRAGPVPWRGGAGRPATGAHPGRPEPARPGESGRRPALPARSRTARAVRRGGRDRRNAGDRVLRIGRDRVPHAAGDGARGPRRAVGCIRAPGRSTAAIRAAPRRSATDQSGPPARSRAASTCAASRPE